MQYCDWRRRFREYSLRRPRLIGGGSELLADEWTAARSECGYRDRPGGVQGLGTPDMFRAGFYRGPLQLNSGPCQSWPMGEPSDHAQFPILLHFAMVLVLHSHTLILRATLDGGSNVLGISGPTPLVSLGPVWRPLGDGYMASHHTDASVRQD